MTVSGAADDFINGVYSFYKRASHGSVFQKNTDVNGVMRKYNLYRWFMKNSVYNWFISQTPPGVEHGTRDIDYFSAQSTYEPQRHYTDDIFPPPTGWKPVEKLEQNSVLTVTWEVTDEDVSLADDSLYRDEGGSLLDDSFDMEVSNLMSVSQFDNVQDSLSNSPAPRDLSGSSDSEIEEGEQITPMQEIG